MVAIGALDGLVAVITGAGGGIGTASARLFAAEGATLALVDVQTDAVAAITDEVVSEGGSAVAITADLTVEDEVRAVVDRIATGLGDIHVVFNNAGIVLDRPLVDTDVDAWDHVLAVNLRSAFLMIKHAAPRMADGGSIINQSSVAALMAVRNTSAYAAAKGGLVSLTRVAAAELGPAIRVNCICPGTVRTQMPEPMLRRRGDGDAEAGARMTARRYLLGRLGEPEEIASTALFLASPASSFFTGAVLVADGGVTAQ